MGVAKTIGTASKITSQHHPPIDFLLKALENFQTGLIGLQDRFKGKFGSIQVNGGDDLLWDNISLMKNFILQLLQKHYFLTTMVIDLNNYVYCLWGEYLLSLKQHSTPLMEDLTFFGSFVKNFISSFSSLQIEVEVSIPNTTAPQLLSFPLFQLIFCLDGRTVSAKGTTSMNRAFSKMQEPFNYLTYNHQFTLLKDFIQNVDIGFGPSHDDDNNNNSGWKQVKPSKPGPNLDPFFDIPPQVMVPDRLNRPAALPNVPTTFASPSRTMFPRWAAKFGHKVYVSDSENDCQVAKIAWDYNADYIFANDGDYFYFADFEKVQNYHFLAQNSSLGGGIGGSGLITPSLEHQLPKKFDPVVAVSTLFQLNAAPLLCPTCTPALARINKLLQSPRIPIVVTNNSDDEKNETKNNTNNSPQNAVRITPRRVYLADIQDGVHNHPACGGLSRSEYQQHGLPFKHHAENTQKNQQNQQNKKKSPFSPCNLQTFSFMFGNDLSAKSIEILYNEKTPHVIPLLSFYAPYNKAGPVTVPPAFLDQLNPTANRVPDEHLVVYSALYERLLSPLSNSIHDLVLRVQKRFGGGHDEVMGKIMGFYLAGENKDKDYWVNNAETMGGIGVVECDEFLGENLPQIFEHSLGRFFAVLATLSGFAVESSDYNAIYSSFSYSFSKIKPSINSLIPKKNQNWINSSITQFLQQLLFAPFFQNYDKNNDKNNNFVGFLYHKKGHHFSNINLGQFFSSIQTLSQNDLIKLFILFLQHPILSRYMSSPKNYTRLLSPKLLSLLILQYSQSLLSPYGPIEWSLGNLSDFYFSQQKSEQNDQSGKCNQIDQNNNTRNNYEKSSKYYIEPGYVEKQHPLLRYRSANQLLMIDPVDNASISGSLIADHYPTPSPSNFSLMFRNSWISDFSLESLINLFFNFDNESIQSISNIPIRNLIRVPAGIVNNTLSALSTLSPSPSSPSSPSPLTPVQTPMNHSTRSNNSSLDDFVCIVPQEVWSMAIPSGFNASTLDLPDLITIDPNSQEERDRKRSNQDPVGLKREAWNEDLISLNFFTKIKHFFSNLENGYHIPFKPYCLPKDSSTFYHIGIIGQIKEITNDYLPHFYITELKQSLLLPNNIIISLLLIANGLNKAQLIQNKNDYFSFFSSYFSALKFQKVQKFQYSRNFVDTFHGYIDLLLKNNPTDEIVKNIQYEHYQLQNGYTPSGGLILRTFFDISMQCVNIVQCFLLLNQNEKNVHENAQGNRQNKIVKNEQLPSYASQLDKSTTTRPHLLHFTLASVLKMLENNKIGVNCPEFEKFQTDMIFLLKNLIFIARVIIMAIFDDTYQIQASIHYLSSTELSTTLVKPLDSHSKSSYPIIACNENNRFFVPTNGKNNQNTNKSGEPNYEEKFSLISPSFLPLTIAARKIYYHSTRTNMYTSYHQNFFLNRAHNKFHLDQMKEFGISDVDGESSRLIISTFIFSIFFGHFAFPNFDNLFSDFSAQLSQVVQPNQKNDQPNQKNQKNQKNNRRNNQNNINLSQNDNFSWQNALKYCLMPLLAMREAFLSHYINILKFDTLFGGTFPDHVHIIDYLHDFDLVLSTFALVYTYNLHCIESSYIDKILTGLYGNNTDHSFAFCMKKYFDIFDGIFQNESENVSGDISEHKNEELVVRDYTPTDVFDSELNTAVDEYSSLLNQFQSGTNHNNDDNNNNNNNKNNNNKNNNPFLQLHTTINPNLLTTLLLRLKYPKLTTAGFINTHGDQNGAQNGSFDNILYYNHLIIPKNTDYILHRPLCGLISPPLLQSHRIDTEQIDPEGNVQNDQIENLINHISILPTQISTCTRSTMRTLTPFGSNNDDIGDIMDDTTGKYNFMHNSIQQSDDYLQFLQHKLLKSNNLNNKIMKICDQSHQNDQNPENNDISIPTCNHNDPDGDCTNHAENDSTTPPPTISHSNVNTPKLECTVRCLDCHSPVLSGSLFDFLSFQPPHHDGMNKNIHHHSAQ